MYQIGVVLYEMLVGIPPFYNEDIKELYHNIQKGKLKIPKYISKQAQTVLYRILEQNPKKRREGTSVAPPASSSTTSDAEVPQSRIPTVAGPR